MISLTPPGVEDGPGERGDGRGGACRCASLGRPLIIDSFAGGGGASEGIRAALGRDPDYALNHDRHALAMHRINHPGAHHVEEDVWNVDAVGLCAGREVGLLWMSPDCKHFSKAKGGRPREKAIRGLAWVGVRWIKSLPKRQRPRVVFLENVEEFADWGPLLEDGRPCPLQRGATFRSFVAAFEAMGYAVEWRELRACDYGAPTIRKRLFLIARRDGRPIVWPEPTHGAPESEGVRSGRLRPWRTAAEIIDWTLPCPSIFDTKEEIWAKYGVRAQRPLAGNTMARLAKGTWRYVVTAARPFLVSVNHGDSRGRREYPLDEPANTMTASRGEALVTPFVAYGQHGGNVRDAADPLHTVTASPKDQNAIVAPLLVNTANGGTTGRAPNVWPADEALRTITQAGAHALVAPVLITNTTGHAAAGPDDPLSTVTTGGHHKLAAAHLSAYYGEGEGGTDRSASPGAPLATDTAGGNRHAVVSGFLVPRYGERPGQDPRARAVDEPAPVIVPTGNEGSLAAVSMVRQFGASVGSAADEPVGTITAGGAGKAGVVAAFLAQHNTARDGGVNPGCDARAPVSTITAAGGNQNLVAAHLTHLFTSNTRGGVGDPAQPIKTVLAGGNHAAAVYAFLSTYYGSEIDGQPVDAPAGAETTKPRRGVVTVTIQGLPYQINDIGMRMLTPRERFSAQGFRRDYVIDRGQLEDGTIVPLTLEQQGRMCGNSVCPPMAEALVAANYREADVRPRRTAEPAAMPLFAAE